MKLSVSILSIKNNLKENILKLDQLSIDYLHLDIMDGKFVYNKTWSINEINELLKNTTKPYDVHLMVKDVYKYIDDYKTIKPTYLTFHYEAAKDPLEIINYIKKNKIKVGMSIKPNTSVQEIFPYLSQLDLVLVMSVEPGEGGQDFLISTVNKIRLLDEIRKNYEYHYLIEVDGGINDETIQYCMSADIIVVGSYITSSDDYQGQIDKLKT